jgi:hypothetical protein
MPKRLHSQIKRIRIIKMKSKLILIISLFCGCAGNIVLQPRSDGTLPLVSVNMQITDVSQKQFADTLGNLLASRLKLFEVERKDFRTISSQDSGDYKLLLRIIKLETVNYEKQQKMKKKRDRIDRKYDKINDSIQAAYKPMTKGQLVAANIATNVVANTLLLPLGFVSVTVIENTGPQFVETSEKDSKSIDSTYSKAKVIYEASLIRSNGELIWKKKNENQFKLNYVVNEQEQIDVLLRNITLFLDDKMPLYKLRK